MANKGLKEENTMLSFEISDIKVYIDLAKENKNVIAYIPLGIPYGPVDAIEDLIKRWFK